MSRFSRTLLIGAAAGVIDIVPMIAQGLNWYANSSAFVQWIVLGIVIPYLDVELKSWKKGLVLAELMVLPVMIIVSMNGLDSILPIIISTAILGSCVGYFGDKYAGKS